MPYDVLSGVKVTRLGRRHSAGAVFPEIDPRGERIYWLGRAGEPKDQGPGTDFDATQHGFVSVSPLQIDLTQYSQLSSASSWFDEALPEAGR